MLQRGSTVKITDNSGGKLGLIIGTYGGHKVGMVKVGDIVKIAVKKALPVGAAQNHQKFRAVIVRTKKEIRREDGTYIRFDDNAVVILAGNSGNDPLSTRIFGPVARELKNAGFNKIISLAPEVL